MNMIRRYILPRIPQVAQRMARNPGRQVFGLADFPTFIAIVALSILFNKGDRSLIVNEVKSLTHFDETHVGFVLDQYEGRNPRYHLWQRNKAGQYRLLI